MEGPDNEEGPGEDQGERGGGWGDGRNHQEDDLQGGGGDRAH